MIKLNVNTNDKNEFQDDDIVCFCFDFTKKDIKEDFHTHGYSKILQNIKVEKKNNGCHCEVKNPRGK